MIKFIIALKWSFFPITITINLFRQLACAWQERMKEIKECVSSVLCRLLLMRKGQSWTGEKSMITILIFCLWTLKNVLLECSIRVFINAPWFMLLGMFLAINKWGTFLCILVINEGNITSTRNQFVFYSYLTLYFLVPFIFYFFLKCVIRYFC